MKVKANFDYNDKVLKRLVKKDEVIEVDDERGKFLMNKKDHGVPFVEFVEETQEEAEEIKEEAQEEKQEEVEEEPKPKKGRKKAVKEE